MEEFRLDEAYGYGDMGIAVLNAITDKARKEGIQIGVPWTKEVYDYLFEATTEADFEEILGLVEVPQPDQDMF